VARIALIDYFLESLTEGEEEAMRRGRQSQRKSPERKEISTGKNNGKVAQKSFILRAARKSGIGGG